MTRPRNLRFPLGNPATDAGVGGLVHVSASSVNTHPYVYIKCRNSGVRSYGAEATDDPVTCLECLARP